jgi:hypothetical protein
MMMKKHKGMQLTLRWVLGHEGVAGNEEADQVVKLAIEEGSSLRGGLLALLCKGLPQGKAAARRNLQVTLDAQAHAVWQQSTCFGKMKEIDDSMPLKRYAKLVAELPRKKVSLIMQLRSGHIPLQAHLFRIAWAEAPDCPRCCARKETGHHFLMVCPAYMAQRQSMANGYIGHGEIVVECGSH